MRTSLLGRLTDYVDVRSVACTLIAVARRAPFTVVGLIGALDVILQQHVPWVLAGALDEPAHLATAALLLAVFPGPLPSSFLVPALAASVLIDIDHVPIYAHLEPLIAAAPRPYTHSLATPAVSAALASVLPRRYRAVLFGITAGLLLHFTRDLATGTLMLFWPVSRAVVRVPYWSYAGVLLAAALASMILYRKDIAEQDSKVA